MFQRGVPGIPEGTRGREGEAEGDRVRGDGRWVVRGTVNAYGEVNECCEGKGGEWRGIRAV